MPRKTYTEKLNSPGGLPKIEDLSGKPEAVKRYSGMRLLVAAPMQYFKIMAEVPEGRILTVDNIRRHLAQQAQADATCPLTAGIFVNICAHASLEPETGNIPWWRTLKTGGELNEKFPDGIDGQRLLLEMEGHRVIQKGKRFFVEDYEQKQHRLTK